MQSRRGVIVNLLLSFAGQALSILGQFALIPAFLSAWGPAVYGDWLTISAISSYLALSDLGIQLYVINLLTGQAVRNEHEEFDRTVQSALVLYAVISVLAIVGLLGATCFLPWEVWFAGRAMSGAQASVLVLLLGVGTLLGVWAGFVSALYRVHGHPQRTTAVGLVLRTLILAATIAALWLRRPPRDLALIQLLLPLLALLWCGYDFRKRHARPVFTVANASRSVALAMLAPSAMFAILGVANGLTIQGTLLFTSAMLGPLAVTTFSTSRTLANAVRQLVSLLSSVAWPEFTRMAAAGGVSRLSAAHGLLVKASSIFAAWMVGALWFGGPQLYAAWTGGRAHFDTQLFRILLLHALLLTPSWCSGALLAATNRHRGLALLYLAQGVITLLLCPLVLEHFGLVGVGGVFLVTDVPLFGVLVPLWSQRELGEPARRYFFEIYTGLVVLGAGALLLCWGIFLALPQSIVGLLLLPLLSVLPVFAGGAVWLRREQRALVGGLLRRRSAPGSG